MNRMTLTFQANPLISNSRALQIAAALRDRAPASQTDREEMLSELLTQYDISLRDLEVLAVLAGYESASISLLSRDMAMRRREAVWHICRLVRAGLADVNFGRAADFVPDTVKATHTGNVLSSILAD